jgi:putative flippase GtrA
LRAREIVDNGAHSRIAFDATAIGRNRYSRNVLVPPEPADKRPPTIWHVLFGRFRREFAELGKFGVVGAVSFVVDTVVYNLVWSHQNSYVAAVISTCASATVAFIGNRSWAWRDRPRSSLHREYALYAVFNVIGLLISLCCLWISRDFLGHFAPAVFHTRLADNVAKQGFGLVLGTMFRFWAYRKFVFVGIASVPETVPADTR